MTLEDNATSRVVSLDLPLPEQPARSMRKVHCSRRSCVSYSSASAVPEVAISRVSKQAGGPCAVHRCSGSVWTPSSATRLLHVRQGSPCLPIVIHLPTASDPDATVDTTTREPCRQDMAVGLISQAVGIGFLLQAFAGQLFLALRVPAVVSLTAEGHHAIGIPLCFEQAGCLLIVHTTGLAALLHRVPSTGAQGCHDVHRPR